MGYIVNKNVAGDKRAYMHSVTRREAAYIMGVKVVEIPEVAAQGGRFANQSNRWAVYKLHHDLKHSYEDARIFTDPKEARTYFDSLQ